MRTTTTMVNFPWIVAVVSTLVLSVQALAQSVPASGTKTDDPFYRPTEQKTMPDLPAFPTYTGQSKLSGVLAYPADKGGRAFTIRMLMREDEQTVLEWYRSALKMYGWTLDQHNNGAHSVGANYPKERQWIVIFTERTASPGGFQTSALVKYVQANAKD